MGLPRQNPGAPALTGAAGILNAHSKLLHSDNSISPRLGEVFAAQWIARKFGLNADHARAIAELAFARREP